MRQLTNDISSLWILSAFFLLHSVVNICRIKKRVQYYSESIIEQLRNYPGQKWAANLEGGVRINFYEIEFEVLIEHEIISKNLKAILESFSVDFFESSPKRILNDFLYLRHYLASDVNLLFRMEGLKVPLKVTNRLFISRLKLTVVLVILLHGIVSEVNEFVFYIICVILLTGSANVRIFIEIPLHFPVYASQESVTSEIKFSAVDEQGVVDVLLNDPTLWLATLPLLIGAHKLLNFWDGGAEVDSVSSV